MKPDPPISDHTNRKGSTKELSKRREEPVSLGRGIALDSLRLCFVKAQAGRSCGSAAQHLSNGRVYCLLVEKMMEEEATFSILHSAADHMPPIRNPVYGRCFRRALLSRLGDQNPRDYLKSLFRDNDAVALSQFKAILKSLDVSKYVEEGEEGESSQLKFINSLLREMNLLQESEVKYVDVCSYLWGATVTTTGSSSQNLASVVDMTRRAIMEAIGDKIIARSKRSKKDDLFLTEAFAKKTSIQLVRGSLLSARHLKKSLPRFLNAQLGEELSNETTDQLIQSLDSNSDGVVSSREFKAWLFAASDSPIPMEKQRLGNEGAETDTDMSVDLTKQPVADTPPVEYVECDPLSGEDPSGYGADDDEEDGLRGFTTPEVEALTPINSEHGGSASITSEGGMSDRLGRGEGNKSPQTAPKQSSSSSTASSCCQCMLAGWGFKLVYEPVGE
jgi:hypothetical protein